MTDHDSPTAALSQLTPKRDRSECRMDTPWVRDSQTAVLRLDGLSHRADLVDFKQQAVTGLLVHSLLDPLGVGHCQVVSYDLIGQEDTGQ